LPNVVNRFRGKTSLMWQVSAGIFNAPPFDAEDGDWLGRGNTRSQAVGFPTPGDEGTNGGGLIMLVFGASHSVSAGATFSLLCSIRTVALGAVPRGATNVTFRLDPVLAFCRLWMPPRKKPPEPVE